MRTIAIFLFLICVSILTEGCVNILAPTRQAIPTRPVVKGELSGLPENVDATIYVRTPQGRTVVWAGAKDSQPWQVTVNEAGGMNYIITTEAEGYVSQPVSYTIHISGDTAYVVFNGQVTDEEAIHLDFHFVPKDSP